MIDLMVLWILTRESPKTVIRLVELSPNAGNWMYVALSLMMVFNSSGRSVTIQSNLRGKMAVSLEMTDLLYALREGMNWAGNMRRTLFVDTW